MYLFCAGVGVAMLSPLLRQVDGFPLSTYPMFARPRGPTTRIHTVLGITAEGAAEVLNPTLIGGDPWSTLAADVADAASRSRSRRRALCETVASRIRVDPDRASRYVELNFVAEVYDAPAYFHGQTEAVSRKVLASCPVTR